MNADEIVKELRESCTGNEFAPPMVTNRELTEAADLIESLQAQLNGAVPVVRCGECKYFMEYRSGFIPEVEKANGDCFIRLMNSGDKQFLAVKYSDYCSYGAKMEVKE